MCGIFGILAPGGIVDERVLIAARDTLTHRGPDDFGLWLSIARDVGLAHRRLSVIDLSPTGHQPMSDDMGSLHLILNGEIYNFRDLRADLESRGYRFRGTSDTEVMLAAYRAWGDGFIERLNGMFAFALYDETKRRLLLARDRAGEKPLFFRLDATGLRFASELKAMLADPAVPRRIDPVSLDLYLAFGYVPAPHCMIAGVQKLPAAHALSYDLASGRCEIWRYWSLPEFAESSSSREELVVELETLLSDAVRRQLYADVHVGILLSGGVDSSLVTAFAAQAASAPVKTFTVAFPGHGTYDESSYARMVASHFGTEHIELVATPADVELLPMLARQYDEPLADSSMVPTYLVSAAIAHHAAVALGGDGGDELFGGYPHHSWAWHQDWIHRFVPAPARRTLAAVGSRLPLGSRGRNHLIGVDGDVANGVAHFNLHFDASTRSRLLGDRSRPPHQAPEAFKAALSNKGLTASRLATRIDFLTYLADDLLVKVDRASMLASLEVRAPFLDYRVVEFAFSRVPDELRATSNERKVLLRAVAERHLPRQLDLRRKQGFSIPLHEWFRGTWGRALTQVLREAPPNLFAQSEVESLLRWQERGRSNTQRIFTLAMFELWRRAYNVALPW
jgi:asparagine synthase (glutamine-hydrolysing)